MSLAPGERIGPYVVDTLIGEGGMGQVYRAHDARLKRDVALKVVPSIVSADASRLQRFEREAQTLAALNHPHIATVLGLEEGLGGTRALVMELVPGDDLTLRISRGPVPWRDACAIARQIADGLEAAHEKGIIHRDLKPGNVKLSADGSVKLLDFGLAKAMVSGDASAADVTRSLKTPDATSAGMILGTPAYMAPEQARGFAVDRRADIWAFGCVLFELLTGRRTFDGDSVTDVLARILEHEPEWTALPPETPPALRRLLGRCLTKDPRARLRDIGEARLALDAILSGESGAPAPPPSPAFAANGSRGRVWHVLPWVVATVLAATSLWLATRNANTPAAGRPQFLEIGLPADIEFYHGPSVSADGRTLAFVGARAATRMVFIRSLLEPDVHPVPGSETASAVTIAPDGLSAAFVTPDTWVSRVMFSSGLVERLASGASLTAPTLLNDGTVIFTRELALVMRLPNGQERELATVDLKAGDVSVGWPMVTADRQFALFVARRQGPGGTIARIDAVSLTGTPNRHVVVDGGEQAVFASADRFVFKRGDALFVTRFQPATATTTGEPVRVDQPVALSPSGGALVTISAAGHLVLVPPSSLDSELVWVSIDGAERPLPSGSRRYLSPRVSPDGRRIAFVANGTVWSLDLDRYAFTRITPEVDPLISFPCWSRDSRTIFYRSSRGIQRRNADGSGDAVILANTGSTDYPNSFSSDGKTLVFQRLSPNTAGDLYTTPAAGGPLTPVLITSAYEAAAQVSPDGRWIVYVSNESGRFNVYMRPFDGPDQKWTVSSQGGTHPLWSPDGRHIYYRSADQTIVVDVTTTPEVRLSEPRVLFERRYSFGQSITLANGSISPDGRELLMVRPTPGGRHLNLILDWLPNSGR